MGGEDDRRPSRSSLRLVHFDTTDTCPGRTSEIGRTDHSRLLDDSADSHQAELLSVVCDVLLPSASVGPSGVSITLPNRGGAAATSRVVSLALELALARRLVEWHEVKPTSITLHFALSPRESRLSEGTEIGARPVRGGILLRWLCARIGWINRRSARPILVHSQSSSNGS